jgi:hypothetical protein
MDGMFNFIRKYGAVAVGLGLLCIHFLPAYAQGRNSQANNCAATPDQILGQAYSRTAGAAGETDEAGLTPEGEDIAAGGLAADARWIVENLQFGVPGSESVAILVVDDFSSNGTGETPASHGWLVFDLLERLHAVLPQETADLITLQQVDIAGEQGYQSDLILPAIQSAIAELSAQGINRFVLNMSFVFIPCRDAELGFNFTDFLTARQNNPARSLVEQLGGDPQYVRSLLNDARVGYIDETGLGSTDQATPRGSQALARAGGARQIPPTPSGATPQFRSQDLQVLRLFNRATLQADPLRDYLRQSSNLIISVASAGNFKQRQPFYPARWPEVISVSANEGNDLRLWLHSNNGDVSVPGAWFLFEDDAYRAGTSFAAPVVSLLISVDLTQTNPTCAIRGNRPVLSHGAYDNELILDAVSQFCR